MSSNFNFYYLLYFGKSSSAFGFFSYDSFIFLTALANDDNLITFLNIKSINLLSNVLAISKNIQTLIS